MYNQEQIALYPRWCSCMTAVTLYSFWGTLVGTLWLCNLFRFKSWNKEQHTVVCSSFPCPKTPGLTLHVLQCYLLSPSISCWLVWLQPQSALIAPLENQQQDRGDVFTTGWIHPCIAKGHVVSSVSAQMDALLLWAPTNSPAPAWEPSGPVGVDSSSRAKFSLLTWVSVLEAGICPWKSVICSSYAYYRRKSRLPR